jgi:predicted RNA-binding Zn-ribbon protein involved in translation (DUF1610 family)
MYVLLVFPIYIVIFIISFTSYRMWYNKNYVTKTSTPKYDVGWHKCIKCKEVESTMYYSQHLFGTTYKCEKCAFPKK